MRSTLPSDQPNQRPLVKGNDRNKTQAESEWRQYAATVAAFHDLRRSASVEDERTIHANRARTATDRARTIADDDIQSTADPYEWGRTL